MPIPATLYDRPSIAAANLMRGDIMGAGQALVAPATLGPERTMSVWEDLKKMRKSNPLLDGMMTIVTDPWFVVGMLLSFRYPVAKLKDLFRVGKGAAAGAKELGMMERKLLRLETLLGGGQAPIPKTITKFATEMEGVRQKWFGKLTAAINAGEAKAGRHLKLDELLQVSAKLEGWDRGLPAFMARHRRALPAKPFLKSIQLSPPQQAVYDKLVQFRAEAYQDLMRPIMESREGQRALKIALKLPADAPNLTARELRNYLPHFPIRSPEGERQFVKTVMDTVRDDQHVFYAKEFKRMRLKVAAPQRQRQGVLIPDPLEFGRIPGANPEFVKQLRGMYEAALKDTSLPMVARYSMEPVGAYTSYVFSTSHPYMWLAKGYGKKFQELAEPLSTSARQVFSEYVPILQGRMNYQQTLNMQAWNSTRFAAMDYLETNPNIQKWVPKKMRDWLHGKLSDQRGPFTYLNAANMTAGWFYHSTLGFNPSSAFKNLLQTMITTIPLIGPSATGAGLRITMKKLTDPQVGYFSLRAKGLSDGEAMIKAFPEFSKTTSEASSLAANIIRGTLQQAWSQTGGAVPEQLRRVGVTGKRIMLDRAKRAAMFMFSSSERFNRLVAFEGAVHKGVSEGMKVADAVDLGAQTVRMTQFAVGVGQMPHGLLNVSAPWRQFMYFPLRFAGYIWESTRLPWGAGPVAARRGKNLGTIGRLMATSSATYHLGRELLGMDLSQGLLTGALPLPQIPEAPFFPFPIVPPAISIPGLAATAAVTQKAAPLQRAGALMVPGGVAGLRAYRSLAGKYARWDQQGPDGKVPLLNYQGSLVARYTPFQLWMRAMGMNQHDMTQEREMSAYILRHRDQIRDIRRTYVNAIVDGQTEEAQRINERFQKAYPQLGELQLKPSDLEAAERRRQMTRLQRLLETMPAAYRPYFQQVVGAALMQDMGNMFGMMEPPGMTQMDRLREQMAVGATPTGAPAPTGPAPMMQFPTGAGAFGGNAFPAALASSMQPIFQASPRM